MRATSSRARAAVRMLSAIAAACLLLQTLGATLVGRDPESPNAAAAMARHFIQTGEYAMPVPAAEPRRAFHLPGEVLFLSLVFAAVPDPFPQYVHVFVTTLFVTSVAAVAFVIGGPRLGLLAGGLAGLDPFVLRHGSVWDDLFLSAALEWLILAMLAWRLAAPVTGLSSTTRGRAILALAAGFAAVTRAQSQLLLAGVGLAAVSHPALRRLRGDGIAILAGIAGALAIWVARNLLVLGAFVPGSTHDGQTLLHANHPRARDAIFDSGTTLRYVDLLVDRELGEVGADRYYRHAAIAYLRTEPVDAAKTAVLKAAASLTGFDFSRSATSARNLVAAGFNVILLMAALWGWARAGSAARSSPVIALLASAGLVTAMVSGAFLALGPLGLRYRLSLAGFLYLGAALASGCRPGKFLAERVAR